MEAEFYEAAVRVLSFGDVERETHDRFAQALDEGYRATVKDGLPAQRFFEDNLEDLLSKRGLLDAWLGTLCLVTFAQGIAAARGSKQVEATDVQKALDELCDRFPKCLVMRVNRFVGALDSMSEGYVEGADEMVGA